jgi:asparagine synthase (glutamine-hydrolysing)
MCGIAGSLSPGRVDDNTAATRTMMSAMARRGPDSEGLETWPGVALGHRRLAILDLSPAGHQPMLADDRSVGLVFNGCIYNFLDIRQELQDLGFVFRSHCDTEVLLRGYQAWGIDPLVQKLRGMYAFAIWDDVQQKLMLVRDRLGVKPLVYADRGGRMAFASTVGALRAGGCGGELNPQAVLEFLEYGYITEDSCIYEGLRKLPPASILEWQNGKSMVRSYWSLPAGGSSSISFEDAVAETERLLIEAVRLRLHADVPVGVLLSGGIDSTLVCWAMAKLNARIKAFTVGMPDDPADESAVARQTAQQLGIPHETVTLPNYTPSLLEEMIDAYSEPFSAQSAQGILRVSQAVKPLATVLLTGDGGDDVFLGYPFFRNAWRAQQVAQRLPSGSDRVWEHGLRRVVPEVGPSRRARNFLDYATGGLGAYARVHDGLPYFEQRAMFGPRLQGMTLGQRQIPASLASARRLLPEVFDFHFRMQFLCEFMQKVDGGTMYHAIEARSPFLDQKLWEFGAALSPQVLLRGGQLKAVLREIVHRHIGPRVALRRKQGFTIPGERWLAGRWSGAWDRLKTDTRIVGDGWVRAGTLQPAINEALEKQWIPAQLWNLLVLEHWLDKNSSPAAKVAQR